MINVYDCIAPVYYDVYDDMKRGGHGEYWLKGGRGSCKSSFAAVAILRGLLADRDANAVVFRRVAATLRDSVFSTFGWAVDRLGLRSRFRFKRSPMELIYLPTGQKILFRGADDPLKSKSIAVEKGHFKYLWFEEMSEFRGEEDIRSIVQSVLRGSDGGILLATFNPPASAASWVNRACLTPKAGRMVLHTTYLDVPGEWLGKRFIAEAEALRNANKRAYDNEYLGLVTGSGGRVFENLVLRPLTEEELKKADRRYYGLDFGFASDPDAFTAWAYDHRNAVLYAVDEYVAVGESPETLARELEKRAGHCLITADSADPRMLGILRAMGLNAVPARKGPFSREHGYRSLQTLRAIVADPARTPHIAREFSLYELKKDKNGVLINAYPDGDDHTIDSCRYALESEFSGRRAVTRSDIY